MSKFNFKDNWRRDVVYVYLKKVLLYRSFKSLYLYVYVILDFLECWLPISSIKLPNSR